MNKLKEYDESLNKVKDRKPRSYPHILFIFFVSFVFILLTLLFIFFPRSEYSELEKRELASFPSIHDYKDKIEEYPAAISQWFSDSEPFRDNFMSLSMRIRGLLKFHPVSKENAISFHASNDYSEPSEEIQLTDSIPLPVNPMANANAKLANAGTIVVGTAPDARALMAFGGTSKSGGSFAQVVNSYSDNFPECNIYALVASSAAEFYLPERAGKINNPETPTLNNIKSSLSEKVKYVNVHDVLAIHINEDIFLRTDHHWAPLGAFYAAQEFAATAGVNFLNLDHYEKKTVHDFVGSMYGYTKDIAIKNSPEDFVYYEPSDIDYETTFITYFTDEDYTVTSESKPFKAPFFKTFKDGHGGAYSTFMGSDQNLVHVSTPIESDRKLLIIKDSFGNALPGYLFYSFSDIYVVDFRYFNRNMKKFVREKGITDILFAFNIFNACNPVSMKKVRNFLTQGDRVKPERSPDSSVKNNTKQISENPIDSINNIEPSMTIEESIKPDIKEKTDSLSV